MFACPQIFKLCIVIDNKFPHIIATCSSYCIFYFSSYRGLTEIFRSSVVNISSYLKSNRKINIIILILHVYLGLVTQIVRVNKQNVSHNTILETNVCTLKILFT